MFNFRKMKNSPYKEKGMLQMLNTQCWLIKCLKASSILRVSAQFYQWSSYDLWMVMWTGSWNMYMRLQIPWNETNFNHAKVGYRRAWKIIDNWWKLQLHRPFHASTYFSKRTELLTIFNFSIATSNILIHIETPSF